MAYHNGVRYSEIMVDSRDISEEGVKAWRNALEDVGVNVYDDPRMAGSDSYGFLLANGSLTQADIHWITDE